MKLKNRIRKIGDKVRVMGETWTIIDVDARDDQQPRYTIKGRLGIQGRIEETDIQNSEKPAFVYCVTCDEGISEARIAEHKKDGHTVEVTKKPVRNEGPTGHDQVEECIYWMRARSFSSSAEAIREAVREGSFDKAIAERAARSIKFQNADGAYQKECEKCGTETKVKVYRDKEKQMTYVLCRSCAQERGLENDVPDDDDEELKRGIIKSMSEPAKAIKNGKTWNCTCGGKIYPVPGEDDRFECDECGQLFEKDDWRSDRLKAVQNNLKSVLDSAVQNGMLSASSMQKLVTRDGFPKTSPPIKFLMPGLVEYEYMNDGQGARVLVTKKAIDKMLADPEKSIVGKPIINLAHRDVSPDDYKNGKADGVVTRAWWDPQEAWFCCEALVWDEDTRNNLLEHAVSCEYTALPPWGPAGTLNQVEYDKEVTDGRFKHLAVVSGPRYEGATLMNSTGGKQTMKLFQWLKKGAEDVKNSVDVDNRTAVEIDGKEIPLENAVAAWKEQEAAKAAKAKAEADALALQNAKVLQDQDTVTIDGKIVKVIDLKNALAEQAKNASEEKMEKDHKDGEHKDKDMDNCALCNAEDKEEEEKEKKDKEAKNTLLMNSQHRNGQHVQPNEKCDICDGIQAERLSNAAKMRDGKLPTPIIPSVNDGLKRGKELMGKTAAQQAAEAAK